MSEFFIRRPVFAAVLSILTMVFGLVSMISLPVARYPEISPPTITVQATYPGADAQTVAETVAQPIEREVNGVEDMLFMESVCANDGSMTLTITFRTGTDLDTANVLVQNRVAIAESRLPPEVLRMGVTVRKRSTDVAVYCGFYSPDGSLDASFLSSYVQAQIQDEIARVPGVGDVRIFGAGQLSMRLWLDAQKMRIRNVTAGDVVRAVRDQNVQVAGGQIGSEPAPEGQDFQYTVNVRGRLADVDEFAAIVVRTDPDGRQIRIGDVARVEEGSENYSLVSRLNGKPSATMAIYQIPGENVIAVVDGIRARLASLRPSLPAGMDYRISYDATDVVKSSIEEVVQTLLITLVLVILTVYIFLQDFRATLIPAATIPVSLIGTFAAMAALGFSINQFTLFGLVLVIGIVVDDAIVVVENCKRHLDESGLSPKAAASKSMSEVSAPIVATTLVLLAVFVPTLFLGGIVGQLFEQFAVTIAIATVFSSINALTLSPALCGVLLRKSEGKAPARGFFGLFNRGMQSSTTGYTAVVNRAMRLAILGVMLFAGVVALSLIGLNRLPTGFVPQEDEGYCIVSVQLPPAASLQRTDATLAQIDALVRDIPGVKDYLTIGGFSLLESAVASNTGFVVVVFEDWSERSPEEHQSVIVAELNRRISTIQGASSRAFPPPSLPGLGVSSGFTLQLQDRRGTGLLPLSVVATEFIQDGNAQSGLQGMFTPFQPNVPQLKVDLNREQVMKLGIPLSNVFEALQVQLGSAYINDFTRLGRNYRVLAQADAADRTDPEDIANLTLRASNGEMIPVGSVASIEPVLGPQTVTRFNLYPSIRILGQPGPGFSSGQALDLIEDMATRKSVSFEWTELSFQERQASTGIAAVFAFSILLVYLVLAAQYESWTVPIAVCLSVPTALLGAVLACLIRGLDNNVYTQIGIVLLIGLATKSAILIVEFAKSQRDSGMSIREAALSASRVRFRAVLMTAFSFILGVIPLLVASGAGAMSRQAIGYVVFGGMLVATVISLIVVPMLYFVIQSLAEKVGGTPKTPAA